MDPIYNRKPEMEAKYLQIAKSGAAYRVKTDGAGVFLQLKDSADSSFRSLFLTNGALQIGPAE